MDLQEELNHEFETWNGIPLYEKCIKHCHAKNVHSIVLKQLEDGRLLRVFIAIPGNELYKNNPKNNLPMCVGFHNHRYDIGLKILRGSLTNHIVIESKGAAKYRLYGYESGMNKTKVVQPKIHFKREIAIHENFSTTLNRGDYFEFSSFDIHSISTEPNDLVAWIILEGKTDSKYQAKLVTNDLLNESSTSSLYTQITKLEVDKILSQII